jgi:hypothetical protein
MEQGVDLVSCFFFFALTRYAASDDCLQTFTINPAIREGKLPYTHQADRTQDNALSS